MCNLCAGEMSVVCDMMRRSTFVLIIKAGSATDVCVVFYNNSSVVNYGNKM